MRKQNNLLIWLLPFFVTPLISDAQTLGGLQTSFNGEKMIILYDLNDADIGQKYRITVFSSYDGYTLPLTFISGDVGENVIPGKQKRIEWEVRKALPATFDGDISIKLRAVKPTPLAEPLKITSIDKTSYKKGSTVQIAWSGGTSFDKVNIDLLKGSQVIKNEGSGLSNTKTYSVTLPTEMEAGNDYSLRLTNAIKPDDKSTSSSFSIKSKLPLAVKLIPVVVVVGVVAVIIATKGKDTPDDGGATELSELPGPAKP